MANITAEENFDSLAVGNYSPTAPWSIVGTNPSVSSDAAIQGNNGLRFADTSSFGRVQYTYSSAWATQVVLSLDFNIQTQSSANMYIAGVNLSTGSGFLADWRVNTNRTITLRNNNVGIATSSVSIAEQTDYHAEWLVDQVNATQELRVYALGSDSPLIALTGSYTGTTADSACYGPLAAAAGGAIDYDDVILSDDWITTVGSPLPVADAGFDQSDIEPFSVVTLDGSGSVDPNGEPLSYSWSQTSGTDIAFSASTVVAPTFVAPATLDGETLEFSLVVNNGTDSSAASAVSVEVLPYNIWQLTANGTTDGAKAVQISII